MSAAVFEFHRVGLAHLTQAVAEQRQRALHARAAAQLEAGVVNLCVHGVAGQRVQVVVEGPLQVDQAALARAVGPVLQG
jgi:hypothetical protein